MCIEFARTKYVFSSLKVPDSWRGARTVRNEFGRECRSSSKFRSVRAKHNRSAGPQGQPATRCFRGRGNGQATPKRQTQSHQSRTEGAGRSRARCAEPEARPPEDKLARRDLPSSAPIEAGKALCDQVPRQTHGSWKRDKDRVDPLKILSASDKSRLEQLIPIRYGGMLQSPFYLLSRVRGRYGR